MVARQRLTACQLRMHEVRPCVLEQLRVVERLHGRRERVVAAERGRLRRDLLYRAQDNGVNRWQRELENIR